MKKYLLSLLILLTGAPTLHATQDRVTLTEAGTLADRYSESSVVVDTLYLSGPVNSADLVFLRSGSGVMKNLKYLDMSGVTLACDDGAYASLSFAPEAGMGDAGTMTYYLSEKDSISWRNPRPNTYYGSCYCKDLSMLFDRHKTLETLLLPASLTAVGSSICNTVTTLKRVVIGDAVTRIGSNAFYGCGQLTYANIPAGVKSIEAGAFAGCAPLGDLSIPAGIEHIGANAFGATGWLGAHEKDNTRGGVIYIGKFAYQLAPGAPADLTFQEGTEVICEHLCYGREDITGITLPQSMRRIGDRAFRYSGVTTVSLNEGLEEIGSEAFFYTGISDLKIPSSVKIIRELAFQNTPITSVRIPEKVEFLGDGAFAFCKNLTSVEWDAASCETGWRRKPEAGYVEGIGYGPFTADNAITKFTIGPNARILPKRLLIEAGSELDITVPATVQHIGAQAFSTAGLRSLTLSEGITSVNDSICMGADQLTTVNLPDKLTRIGKEAFSYCSNLRIDGVLADDIEEIDDRAFQSCKNVTFRGLPSALKRVGDYAFYGINMVTIGGFPEGLEYIGDCAFEDCGLIRDSVRFDNLKHLGADAFASCMSIYSVELPEGLKEIGRSAFYNCMNLGRIVLPSTLESIGQYAFYYKRPSDALPIHVISLASTPPTANGKIFMDNTAANGTLTVPCGCDRYYQIPYWWNGFGTIEQGMLNEDYYQSFSFADKLSGGVSTDDVILHDNLYNLYFALPNIEGNGVGSDGLYNFCSTTSHEAAAKVQALRVGVDRLPADFRGIVFRVPAGNVEMTLKGESKGRTLYMKYGDAAPVAFPMDAPGNHTLRFAANKPTNVVLYLPDTTAGTSGLRAAGDYLRLESLNVYTTDFPDGIDTPTAPADAAPVEGFYTPDGCRHSRLQRGVNIVRRTDGSSQKVLIK